VPQGHQRMYPHALGTVQWGTDRHQHHAAGGFGGGAYVMVVTVTQQLDLVLSCAGTVAVNLHSAISIMLQVTGGEERDRRACG